MTLSLRFVNVLSEILITELWEIFLNEKLRVKAPVFVIIFLLLIKYLLCRLGHKTTILN